ncbi:protein of unknown function [Lishizhenia tianjinensis]|uniref:DUF4178 domain-containing protein n=1 Tax=Lishizhenia tianjinensis TaxID=477690 RepID=A0A1I7AF88_9FLAO|nr:DUF4178 domain-containing protein [Lishizhenia tianjinensis]SFT73500.1 protein of unknown function [Lishizhenia tianjinensis]
MFEKIINFFKGSSKDPQVDFKVKDLKVGYILEYNLTTWMVEKEYHYNWGEGYASKEWLIMNGNEKALLFYDDSEGEEISISKEINLLQDLNSVREEIITQDIPRRQFAYEGKTWSLTSENPCLYSEVGKGGQIEMVVWVFEDTNKDEFISFSRTGENNVTGYKGSYLKEFEIGNILPSQQ